MATPSVPAADFEEAYMARHGGDIEQALSDAVGSVVKARADNPIASIRGEVGFSLLFGGVPR